MLRLCLCLRLLCGRMRDCLVWALSLVASTLMLMLAVTCAFGLLGLVRRHRGLLLVSCRRLGRRPSLCRWVLVLRLRLRLWDSLDSRHARVLLAWLLLSFGQGLVSLLVLGLSASCLQLSLLVLSLVACWLRGVGLGYGAKSMRGLLRLCDKMRQQVIRKARQFMCPCISYLYLTRILSLQVMT